MTSNDAIAQGFIPYPYAFPAIKFEVADEEATISKVQFIQIVHIPEVTEAEYIAQVKDVYGDDVTNAEALELLYADVAIDDHLDTALELE